MVIFTSDNGPEKSWKSRITEFNHRSNGNYRGGKRDIYEGGHRVPFFIRWPKGIKNPGRSTNQLVGQVDILATVAELIGAKLPANGGEDSHSFASILTQPETAHQRVPLINHSASGRFSITEGDWKLIMPHRQNKRELYQLSLDPSEENNVLLDNPVVAQRLEAAITKIVCQGRSTPGLRQSNDTGYWKDLSWIQPKEYEQ